MADIDTSVNLDDLHHAITSQIAAAFPDFQTVEFYRDDESERFPLPGLLLELSEAEHERDDFGTGQWIAKLRFEARLVMGLRSPSVRQESCKAGIALSAWLHLRRWQGIPTDEAHVITCERDAFSPHLDQFAVWRVEWTQVMALGQSAWTNDGTIPNDVYVGISPDIGMGHTLDYEQVVS